MRPWNSVERRNLDQSFLYGGHSLRNVSILQWHDEEKGQPESDIWHSTSQIKNVCETHINKHLCPEHVCTRNLELWAIKSVNMMLTRLTCSYKATHHKSNKHAWQQPAPLHWVEGCFHGVLGMSCWPQGFQNMQPYMASSYSQHLVLGAGCHTKYNARVI